jgi:hypothetical protein
MCLNAGIVIGRTRIKVVNEHHAVHDEDFVFDKHALADESM